MAAKSTSLSASIAPFGIASLSWVGPGPGTLTIGAGCHSVVVQNNDSNTDLELSRYLVSGDLDPATSFTVYARSSIRLFLTGKPTALYYQGVGGGSVIYASFIAEPPRAIDAVQT